jgi:branched-chain amino acid transport system permease protein
LVQFGRVFNEAAGTNINFPSYNFFVFGLLLVLMMLFRREGFIPEARTRIIMHEEDLDSVDFVEHKEGAH